MTDIATPRNEEIDCPFCKKNKIAITTIPEHYSYHSARAFGKVKRIPVVHPERVTVHNSCKNCGKTKQEIKEGIIKGSYGISHHDRLKRLKEAGLPTRIEG